MISQPAILTGSNYEKMIAEFKASSTRCLFLDYDGTLIDFHKRPEMAAPSSMLLDLLGALVRNMTQVVLVSGRDRDALSNWFSQIDVQLAAEHGCFYRTLEGDWTDFCKSNIAWKDAARPVMNMHAAKYKGSFVEEKSYSLVWHYRNISDAEKSIAATTLAEDLRRTDSLQHLSVLEGNNVIELKTEKVNKGHIVKHLLAKQKFHFILAIGDDTTDEDMFVALPEHSYSIKVGRGTSMAKYYLRSPADVIRLLKMFLSAIGVEVVGE